ncbi:MAG: hypothetical protein O2931_17910 [Planctomycetota bacterium]|nr:hypothetical protein [Planctomycetota bacterium]
MRLTLRTLLAYLDGVLETEDAQDLQRKIDGSPLAQGLIQRIEDTLRRSPPTEVSPDAVGEEDANLVAEYLDSTLRPDLEPEFEHNCLEVDVRLEEIAACHQILSMVVRERTPVSETLRERIHGLRERFGWSGSSSGAPPESIESRPGAWLHPPGSVPSELPFTTASERGWEDTADHEPAFHGQNPDTGYSASDSGEDRWRNSGGDPTGDTDVDMPYEKSRQSGPILPDLEQPATTRNLGLPTLIVSLLAIGLGTLAVRPDLLTYLGWNPGNNRTAELPLVDPMASQNSSADENGAVTDSSQNPKHQELDQDLSTLPSTKQQNPEGNPEDIQLQEATGPSPTTVPPPTASEAESGLANLQQPPRFQPQLRPATTGNDPPATSNETAREVDTALSLPTANSLPKLGDQLPPEFPPGEASEPESAVAEQPSADNLAASLPIVDPPLAPTENTESTLTPPPVTPQIPAKPPLRFQLNSLRDVVVIPQDDGPAWVRSAADEDLSVGRVHVVLPTYRSMIQVNRGLQLTFVGPAEWRFAERADGEFAVELRYGKFLAELLPGQSHGQLEWQGNGSSGVLLLQEPGTLAAVSVTQVITPGGDPTLSTDDAENPAVRRVNQFTLRKGKCTLQASNKERPLRAEATWNTVDDRPGFESLLPSGPNWIDGSDVVPIDQQTSRELEPFLLAGGAILPVLLERSDDRRVEQRSLAVRCLVVLREPAAAWDSLNRADQKSYWGRTIETMRNSLAQDSALAKAIQESINAKRSVDGRKLFRMLRGYSQEDLDRGAAAELVEYLSHESLDVRVLAAENLERIMGRKGFRPEQSKLGRAASIKQWQQDLEQGKIRYANNDSVVPSPGPAKPERATTR